MFPLILCQFFFTTTRKKSLRTKEEAVAKKRLWPVIEAWRTEFDDARARRVITPDDQAVAVWQHYEAITKQYDRKNHALPTPAEIEAEESRLMRQLEQGEIQSDITSTVNAYSDYEMMLSARDDYANKRARRQAALRRGHPTRVDRSC